MTFFSPPDITDQHEVDAIPSLPAFIIDFNPRDKDELLAVDAWACSVPEEVFPVAIPYQVDAGYGVRPQMCDWPDWLLADWLDKTRACFRWGIAWDMRQVASATLELLDGEARRRVRMAEKREKALRMGKYASWEDYDLLGAVEALCGEGRKVGGEWWFRCPWHEDRSPSLEVNAEKKLWHCWGCDAKGGVVEWRKRMERA